MDEGAAGARVKELQGWVSEAAGRPGAEEGRSVSSRLPLAPAPPPQLVRAVQVMSDQRRGVSAAGILVLAEAQLGGDPAGTGDGRRLHPGPGRA